MWRLRRRYMSWLKDNHADNERFDPSWLLHLVVLGIAASVYWIANTIVSIRLDFDFFENFAWDFIALLIVFVIALEALVGIHQRFPKMEAQSGAAHDEPVPAPPRDWKSEGRRLQEQAVENQWYLEPDLSLQVLSRRFGMNHAYISRAINEGLGCNFNGFINKLRVEHAQDLISGGDTSSLTDIALAAGFGSKASFNRAFKLHTSASPSEFRRKCMSG